MNSRNSPKVSIVIVTYNSEKTIQLCLSSIQKSDFKEFEIIVVDNYSEDQTVPLVQQYFPLVTLLKNQSNEGFSKACNKGVRIASGKFLLFLNPDCLIQEDTISQLFAVANEAGVGAVGPLLIDGNGKVLPESARNRPSPLNGLFHMLNLNLPDHVSYYKNVEANRVNNISVLSGACLMINSELYKNFDGFDERYFMYGEDMDLSREISEHGFQNKCTTRTSVLHFKGESTDRSNFIYSYRFYKAIFLYLEKWTKGIGGLFIKPFLFVYFVLVAVVSWILKTVYKLIRPITDIFLIMATFFFVQFMWSYAKSGVYNYFGLTQYVFQYIFYSSIFILIFALGGAYSKKGPKLAHIVNCAIIGSLLIWSVYSTLPEYQRFSRIVIFAGSSFAGLLLLWKYSLIDHSNSKNRVSISNQTGFKDHLPPLLENAEVVNSQFIGAALDNSNVVFDFRSVSNREIFHIMTKSKNSSFFFWDSSAEKLFTSSGRKESGMVWSKFDYFNLNQNIFKTHKRIFDLSLIGVLFIPLLVIKFFSLKLEFDFILKLILGKMTIVGYDDVDSVEKPLPTIKPFLLHVSSEPDKSVLYHELEKYAYSYTVLDDLYVVVRNFGKMIRVLVNNRLI